MNLNQSKKQTMALCNPNTGQKIGTICLFGKSIIRKENHTSKPRTLYSFHITSGRSGIRKQWNTQRSIMALKNSSRHSATLKGKVATIAAYPAKRGEAGLIEISPDWITVKMPAITPISPPFLKFRDKLNRIWAGFY